MSPAFVVGYLITDTLNTPNLAVSSLLLLYLPQFLCGVIALALRRNRRPILQKATKRPASGSQITFKIIDAGIMNGFETLTKLGGYIMLFSMLSSLLAKLPVSDGFSAVLIGIVEITNGVRSLAGANLSPQILYAVAMALTSFGGLSGLAQTGAMIQETDLSLKKYCIGKILLALLTGLLAWFSLAYRM
jgi:hypothetical protein